MRSKPAHRWWIAGLLALVAVAFPTVASAQAQGRARLELVEAVAGQHVVLRYTIENSGDTDLAVLKWETPLGGFFGDILDVRVDGHQAPYIGRLYKLGNPRPENYILVAAGDSASVDFDLGEQYLLDRGGQYSVAWRGEPGLDDAKRLTDTAPAPDTLRFAFDGLGQEAADRYFRGFEQALQGGGVHNEVAYEGCSSTEQSQALAGYNQAKSYAAESSTYLGTLTNSNLSSSQRYKKWFGAADGGRLNTVKSHFTKIKGGLNGGGYTFVCDCDESGVFAYVFPNMPYEVHLCPEYWNAPTKGTDSKGGTLIHESSHFFVNGGTHDHVYGQNGAASLASSNPSAAVDNADNHEYFAENNPALCKGSNCGGGGGGGGGNTAAVNWTLKDQCNDGRGFRVKFQDSKGNIYPNANQYFVLPSNKTGTAKFNAPRGSTVCLGASTDPPNNYYWCKGINFNHPPTSSACCKKVPNSGSLNYTLLLQCKVEED